MRSFKMKDLMVRIQPETLGRLVDGINTFNEEMPVGHQFGTCQSPSTCGTPSTCSSAQSCRPSRCGDTPKPKPKPKHKYEEPSGNIELVDLKNMLAEMQIKLARRSSELAEMP
ncbi:MAG TPA: hypothetical protein VGI82_01475 [Chitinophagaceae bacterium]|jgi:hypothetical protein